MTAKTKTKPKVAQPKKPQVKKAKPLAAFILLDRTGSMQRQWSDAVGGVKTYVKTLAADKKTDADVTLMVFDTEGFDFLAERIKAKAVNDNILDSVHPRGGTPLFDAIARIAAKIPDKGDASLCIVTDGEENSSREVSQEKARQIIEGLTKRGVLVNYLGAGHDAFLQAGRIGVAVHATMNHGLNNFQQAVASAAQTTVRYAAAGGASNYGGGHGSSAVMASFNAAERSSAGEDADALQKALKKQGGIHGKVR